MPNVCEAVALELPLARATRSIDLKLMPGQVLLLDGEPEAGRSTLLKVIAGLLRPRGGELLLFGTRLEGATRTTLARLRERLGVVFEKDGLIPSWNALDNLMLPLRFRVPGHDRTHLQRIHQRLERLHEHPDILAKRVSELTGRQRRRLALLRALLIEPDLMLLDDLTGYVTAADASETDILSQLAADDRALIACAPSAWSQYFDPDRVSSMFLKASRGPSAQAH